MDNQTLAGASGLALNGIFTIEHHRVSALNAFIKTKVCVKFYFNTTILQCITHINKAN